MSTDTTIQFPGELESFIQQRRLKWIEEELALGMKAAEAEFVPLDAATVIVEAKARKQAHGL